MKQDELLTKLAMELAEWPESDDCDSCLPDGWSWIRSLSGHLLADFGSILFMRSEWLSRRRELINEPDDKDAPVWAEWVAQDSYGEWYWHVDEPYLSEIHHPVSMDGWYDFKNSSALVARGKIPAGHDWRKTLRRVKRKEGIKACIQDTNTRHEHDPVNHPKHYKLFPDLESIDVIQRSLTPEQFKGFCMGNALKYRLRAGEEGDAAEDLAKANWYRDKLAEVISE